MATSAGCSLCSASLDTWRHSLLECTLARCVWALLDEELIEHISINRCENAKEWLFFLLDSLAHADFIKVVVTIWAITSTPVLPPKNILGALNTTTVEIFLYLFISGGTIVILV
jgi:hypothetical protein